MSPNRPNEPKPRDESTERVDPKRPPDELSEESETERQARESEKAFDQAITRMPPG